MKNKIYFIGGLIAIISMLIIPNVTSYQGETMNSNEVYETGWFILSSPNIEGIEEGLNLGGMHDLNFTAKGENTFIIFTKPIWGATIIADYVDLHIQTKNFFGISDVYGGNGVVIGKCEDVLWEKI